MLKKLLIVLGIMTAIGSIGYFGYHFVSDRIREQEMSNRRTDEILARSRVQREALDRKIAAIEPRIEKARVLVSDEQIARSLGGQDGVNSPPEFDSSNVAEAESSPTDTESETYESDRPSRRKSTRVRRSFPRKSYLKSDRDSSSSAYSGRRSRGGFRARSR